MQAESKWGSKFWDTLSTDLRRELPNAKGFSRTNLFYMFKFYRLYGEAIAHQLGEQLDKSKIIPQVGERFEDSGYEYEQDHKSDGES